PEVWNEYRQHRHRIVAKNLATTIILAFAGMDLVNPMRTLEIDLAQVMEQMYTHYYEITHELPAVPEQAVLDAVFAHLRKRTTNVIRNISTLTDESGRFDTRRFIGMCGQALRSPRALRELLGA